MASKTLCSVDSFRKYGVKRSVVHHLLLNNFHYPIEFQDTLEDYFILHWTPSWVGNQLINGIIQAHEKEYIAVFHKLSARDLLHEKELRLSFRSAKPEYNLPAYVLIGKVN